MSRRKSGFVRLLSSLAAPVAIVAALVWFSTGLGNVDAARSQEDRRQLEDVLRRATVSYYASYGTYPPDLDTLTRRCGVQIDGSRYVVRYEAIGGNLMPDITVLELG